MLSLPKHLGASHETVQERHFEASPIFFCSCLIHHTEDKLFSELLWGPGIDVPLASAVGWQAVSLFKREVW